jgi:hypothetical protein
MWHGWRFSDEDSEAMKKSWDVLNMANKAK